MIERHLAGGSAVIVLAVACAAAPSASALDSVSVSAPVAVPVPAAPQVPSLGSPASPPAAPVAAPSAPAPLTAPPVGSVAIVPAPVQLAVAPVAAVRVRGTRAGSSGGAAPASSEPQARRAARQTRKLRRTVMSMRGCLWALDRREERYLKLRAGIGRPHPLGRAAAADRIRLPRAKASRFERRALAGLRQACGGGTGLRRRAARPHAYVAQIGAAPAQGGVQVEAAVARSPGAKSEPTADALGPRPFTGGGGGGGHRGAVPRVAGTASEPAGGKAVGAWLAAAIAALAALAGASLVRTRWRTHYAAVAMPGFAPAEAPARSPQALVTRALESLSKGDIAGAAALMHPDVRWPGLGHGTLEGRSQFEDYWADRLNHVRVEIEPVDFQRRNGELVAEVNEVVRGRDYGTTVGEYHAIRRFTFRDGLIAEMKRGRG